MAKPIPPSYGRKGYGMPTRGPARQPAARGQVRGPGAYPPRPIEELGVVFHPDGRVTVPHDLRKKQVTLPNPYTAVRHAHHVRQSIATEAHALKSILDGVRGAHFTVEKRWKQMSRPEQRKLIDYLNACLGAFGDVERLSAPFKVSAAKRLENGVSLLEDGNVSASQASVMGMSRDLLSRINESIGQRKGIQRRHLALVEETRIRGNKLVEYLTHGDNWSTWLHAPALTIGQRSRIARQLDQVTRSMSSKIEPELVVAREQLEKAKAAIGRNEVEMARTHIRAANGESLKALARQYIVPLSVLERIAFSRNEDLRKRAFAQQFEILGDNIHYWSTRAPNPRKIVAHLQSFARLAQNNLPSDQVHAIQEAAELVDRGSATLAEKKILSAIGKKKRTKRTK